MATEVDAVARGRELLRDAGGSMPMADFFNRLFAANPGFRPLIQRARAGGRRFCARHPEDFSVHDTRPGRPGGEEVVLAGRGAAEGGQRRPTRAPGRRRDRRRNIHAIATATAFWRFLIDHPDHRVNDYLELQDRYESWLACDDCPVDIRAGVRHPFSTVKRSLFMTGILHCVGPTVVYSPMPGFVHREPHPLAGPQMAEAIAQLRRLAQSAPPPTQTADEATQRVNEQRRQHESDRGGVSVGLLALQGTQPPGSTQTATVSIENSTDGIVQLLSVVATRARFRGDLRSVEVLPMSLPPHAEGSVTVTCHPVMPQGVLRTVLLFDFGPEIQIARYVEVIITDPADDELRARTPFVRRRRRPRRELGEALLEGDRPQGSQVQWTEPLERYPIPQLIKDGDWRLSDGRATVQQVEQLQLSQPLSPENYSARFHTLLWLEERQMERDIRSFDIDDAVLVPSGRGFLKLNVPGLAEKRPSVLRGDHLFARALGQLWKGWVHRVEREDVLIKFHRRLPAHARLSAEISFSFARTQLQIAHRAVQQTDDWRHVRSHVLFPRPLDGDYVPDSAAHWQTGLDLAAGISAARWHNGSLNDEQRVAVASMVEVSDGDVRAPFVLFGPPGTGKTITVVEAIKQIADDRWLPAMQQRPGSTIAFRRILVAAPSNSAADLLCGRLSTLPTTQMLRVNAYQRDRETVEPTIMRFCESCYVEGGGFELPTAEKLSAFSVVVCTFATAGKLLGVGMRGGFSHVFLDEAGHAHEPEAVSAFAGLLAPNAGRVVMAGDPRQLGAIIRSNIASTQGLGESLLERIMTRYEKPRLMAALARLALMAGMDSGSGSPLEHLRFERERVAILVPMVPDRVVIDRFSAERFAWHEYRAAAPEPDFAAPQIDLGAPTVEPEPEPDLGPEPEPEIDEAVLPPKRRHDWRVCVKLLQNYRSHPDLLTLPSQLFYGAELIPNADPVLTNSFLEWDGLPSPGFPLVRDSAPISSPFCQSA